MNKKPEKPITQESLRAAAEKELACAPKPKPKPKPKQLSAEELLHELQVHQIELEMQNEQLRQAQIALEKSRDSYVDLYEFAPVGYLTLTATGQIKETNLTCAMLFNTERKNLLHHRFSSFVAPECRERWNRTFVSILKRSEVSDCELGLKGGGGEHFYARLNCMCLMKEGAAPEVRITLTDITRIRQAEEVMRNWQQFVDCAHWGMAIGRMEDRVIKLANPAYARMHGYTLEELQGVMADSLYAPESRANLSQYAEILGSVGCYTLECVRLRKDGSTFPAMMDVSTIQGADGEVIYVASVTDITGRKQTERQLRDLTAHLQTVREEEKTLIAREIHDDMGGTLTALKMEAYWLAEELSAHKEAAPLLKHTMLMAQLVDNATGVMRRIITGLRPTILDDLGLLAALEWQCAEFQNRTGILCRMSHVCTGGGGDGKELDKHRSIALFRILQEAITNVSRHSRATKVDVEFFFGDDQAMLSISDNGCGLPEDRDRASSSYGMLGMTERAEQLGGKIVFDRSSSGGLRVTVTLPLSAGNREEERA